MTYKNWGFYARLAPRLCTDSGYVPSTHSAGHACAQWSAALESKLFAICIKLERSGTGTFELSAADHLCPEQTTLPTCQWSAALESKMFAICIKLERSGKELLN